MSEKRLKKGRIIAQRKKKISRRNTSGTTVALEESQGSTTKQEILKDDSSKKNKKDKGIMKYWQAMGYRIFVGILIVINLIALCINFWLYAYLSLPFVYNLCQIVLEKSGIIISAVSLIIPVIGTPWLCSRDNEKGFQLKDLGVYGGTLVAILLFFCSLELIICNLERDDYLYRLSEANNDKTRIPGLLLPIKTTGVRIGSSGIEKKFEFGYNKDNYSLKLKNIENQVISIKAGQLTADFLNKNKDQIVKLIMDKQIDRADIKEYMVTKLSAGDFIKMKKKDGSFQGNRWITGIILVEFIKSHWDWGIFHDWEKDAPEGGYYKMLIGWLEKHLPKNGVQHGAK